MNTWLDGMQCAAGICADKAKALEVAVSYLSGADEIRLLNFVSGIKTVHADILRAIIKSKADA